MKKRRKLAYWEIPTCDTVARFVHRFRKDVQICVYDDPRFDFGPRDIRLHHSGD